MKTAAATSGMDMEAIHTRVILFPNQAPSFVGILNFPDCRTTQPHAPARIGYTLGFSLSSAEDDLETELDAPSASE